MIRIAYVIDTITSPYAGTEKQLLQVIQRLDRNEFEPHLICMRSSTWSCQTEFDFPQTEMDFHTFLGTQYFGCRRRFAEYCQANQIDVIQTFFHDSNLAGTLWGRYAQIPVIIASRRNIGAGYWHSFLNIRLLRWLRHRTTHYLTNSRAAAQETTTIEKVDPRKITVIPNGMDSTQFADPGQEAIGRIRAGWGFEPDDTVVGTVANLRPIKNLSFLIDAAAQLAPRFPRLRFVIIGEGDQRQDLQDQIDRLGLTSIFHLAGRSSEVARELYALDLAVLVSAGESLSNSLMEFMAAGRAAVASDVGGNSELIDSDRLGRIYPSGNLDAFCRTVTELIGDPGLRKSIGRMARESISGRYSWDIVMAQWEDIYRRLVANKA